MCHQVHSLNERFQNIFLKVEFIITVTKFLRRPKGQVKRDVKMMLPIEIKGTYSGWLLIVLVQFTMTYIGQRLYARGKREIFTAQPNKKVQQNPAFEHEVFRTKCLFFLI